MRREHGWIGSVADRAIDVPGHEESRQALEIHLRNAVVVLPDLPEDGGAQRRLFRKWEQAGGREYVLAQISGPGIPFACAREFRRRKAIIERSIRRVCGRS